MKRALKGKAQCETVWGHTLYHPEDVPYKLDMSDLPDTFTPARHKVRYTPTSQNMSHQLLKCSKADTCCVRNMSHQLLKVSKADTCGVRNMLLTLQLGGRPIVW